MPAQSCTLCQTHWLHGPADLQIGPCDQESIFSENKQTKPERDPSGSLGDTVTWGLGAQAVSLSLSESQLSTWKVRLKRIPNVTRTLGRLTENWCQDMRNSGVQTLWEYFASSIENHQVGEEGKGKGNETTENVHFLVELIGGWWGGPRVHFAGKGECLSLSHAQLFSTPWTIARQAPLSKGFSRQEYWGRLSCSPPGLPTPGTELRSPALQADSSPSEVSPPQVSSLHHQGCQVRLLKWRSQLSRTRELGSSEFLSWGKPVLDRSTEHGERRTGSQRREIWGGSQKRVEQKPSLFLESWLSLVDWVTSNKRTDSGIDWRRKCPLQYSCLGNPMDRGAWRAMVHGVAKSWTWLNHFSSGVDGNSIMDRSGQYLLKPLVNLGFTKVESFGP